MHYPQIYPIDAQRVTTYNEWIDLILSMACLAYKLGSSYKTAGLSNLFDKLLSPRKARNESATLFDNDLRS